MTEDASADEVALAAEGKVRLPVQREVVLPFSPEGQPTYRADLVAERDEEHQVIEVTLRGVRGEPQGRRWSEIAQEIRARPGWHFQIVLVDREPPAIPDAGRIATEIACWRSPRNAEG